MLLALGSNGSSQLGIGHSCDVSIPHPVALQDAIDISQIASGGNHSLFLLDSGAVLGCGAAEVLPLGTEIGATLDGSDALVAIPRALQWSPDVLMRNVTRVSATWSASFFLTHDGALFACGQGRNGELGLGRGIVESKFPRPIPDFPPPGTCVCFLSSSMSHTVAVLDNGEVYGWGKGRHGQLGDSSNDSWSPKVVHKSNEFWAVAAACGKDFTCLIDREESGRILILGLNRRDRFGIRKNAPRSVPFWMAIVATWGGIYILKESGQLVTWGRNDHGQLPGPHLPLLRAITAGSEHCLAVTKENDIIAWGWGEHGNCGVPAETSGWNGSSWNTLIPTNVIEHCAVHAGCATSFVYSINSHASLPPRTPS